jgi:hypothetical protein
VPCLCVSLCYCFAEKRSRESKNYPHDTITQKCHVEVHEQTDPQARESQVRDDLCRVDGCQPFNALELNEYPFLDDEIGSIAGVDELPPVDQRDDSFADRTQSAEAQFMAQALPVRRLE